MAAWHVWVAFMSLALGVVAVLVAAPVSRWLVGMRARRLPPRLEQRLREEWLAEVTHLRTATARLAFALRLFFTRTRSLASAMDASDAPADLAGAVVLSDDRIRVAPAGGDVQIASTIDFLILIALILIGAAALSDGTFRSLWVSLFVAVTIWNLVVLGCFTQFLGATPGELVVGLRRVPLDGTSLTGKQVAWMVGPFYLGFVASWTIFAAILPIAGGSSFATLTTDDATAVLKRPLVQFISFVFYVRIFITKILQMSKASADGQLFDHKLSGTTLVYRIPRVTGVPEERPPRSTSAMR